MASNRPLDHKEYIKLKYLSEPTEEVKEKKLRKKAKVRAATKISNIRIFDDDLDLNKLPVDADDDALGIKYGTREEQPSIAMVIDERSSELRRRDIDKSTWKPVAAPAENQPIEPPSSSSKVTSHASDKPISSSSLKSIKREPGIDDERDLSPPRKMRDKMSLDDKDLSPPRLSSNQTEERDSSPPRRRNSGNLRRDVSPLPRSSKLSHRESVSRHGGSSSPPYHRERNDSARNLTSVRSTRWGSTSPPVHRSDRTSRHEIKGRNRSRSPSPPSQSRRRNKLGLIEEEMGRSAKTVYRDRGTGQMRDMEAEARTKVKPDPEQEELKRKYELWSKGVKQAESLEHRKDEVLREMDKPLARYDDDEDRDKYLKDRELEDDPMLKYIRKKKLKEEVKKAESDGKVYLVKPKYKGPPAAPNRFAIEPGYRWDGVDRSNGFEKKLMSKDAEKIANLDEAYKWSTEDM